jgi:maltooligosyltrehalose trehalohydrolase
MSERRSEGWRRLPVGAEVAPGGGVHFRVWAPQRKVVEVVLEGGLGSEQREDRPPTILLSREAEGYHSGAFARAGVGTLYRYRLDGDGPYADPASRFQPDGPFGPSQVVDPAAFRWTDRDWCGIGRKGQVIYEIHVGTFTPEGTWVAAAERLPTLAELGITALEVMPIADFPGRFGWGYDGVNPFAPTRLYGTPDDLRRFVDRAHALGLGVILDVVYNHLGAEGNVFPHFAREYFTDAYKTEWGVAFNFDGKQSEPVREFFLTNAGYWIDEFHLDGLRLDAMQAIFDYSREPILAAIVRRVRGAARGRSTLVIGENEPQKVRHVEPIEQGGFGLDALWNDDFHHAAMVALTGHNEAYYTDYRGAPQEFISALKWGYLYQGQRYTWQDKRRGTPTYGLEAATFILYLQNHDQVANTIRGQRVHRQTSPGRLRAMTALMLLAPGTPMLFQGQEFAASSPFLYFADHQPDLARIVYEGHKEFMKQFRGLNDPEAQAVLADPADPATFARSKLDHSERDRNPEVVALHRDLLRLRREDPVFGAQDAGRLHGAVLGPEAFVLRYFGEDEDDRLVLVNFGLDLRWDPAPEPLLAPPVDRRWAIVWSSDDPRYGGGGVRAVEAQGRWLIPGQAAVVLAPRTLAEERIIVPTPRAAKDAPDRDQG